MRKIYTVIGLGPDRERPARDYSRVSHVPALSPTHAAHRARMAWAHIDGCGDGDFEILAVFEGGGPDSYQPNEDEAERNLRLDAEFEAQERVAEDDAVPDDETYRSRATEIWCNEEVQIDGDAMVSASDSGAWVQAWVWVDNSNLDEA